MTMARSHGSDCGPFPTIHDITGERLAHDRHHHRSLFLASPMFRRNFYPDRFLADVTGTAAFREYCESREIRFSPRLVGVGEPDDLRRWQEALGALSEQSRADVELELAQVNDLACRDSIYHLIDVCAARGLPSDLVPGEAAQSLWFLVHHPSVFQEVFFHEEVLEAGSWYGARTDPRIDIADHANRRLSFEQELARLFAAGEGPGRFCASQSYHFTESGCVVFVGFVADRLKFLEAFTEAGEHRRQKVRPASQILFAYYPADGTVLLKSRCRAVEKVREQLRKLCRAVLRADVDERSLGQRYDLDQLLDRFDPPLPEGVAQVRVQSLELAYPAVEGRRRLRLETNASDGQFAIQDLLAAHVGSKEARHRLRVIEARLQVKLAVRGRAKNFFIRLWSHRCSLNQTPTAEMLRRCLKRWGLTHDEQH